MSELKPQGSYHMNNKCSNDDFVLERRIFRRGNLSDASVAKLTINSGIYTKIVYEVRFGLLRIARSITQSKISQSFVQLG